MSEGRGYPWTEAVTIAAEVSRQMSPHVARMKVVGSLRRQKPRVHDVEFVVEPRYRTDLFDEEIADIEIIRHEFRKLGSWVKGGRRMMQVTDTLGAPDLKVELYIVHPPAQWGSILAIRTGPAVLGELAMKWMRKRDYMHQDGYVLDLDGGTKLHPTPTEDEFFRVAGLPCVPPAKRLALAQHIETANIQPPPREEPSRRIIL